MARYIGRSINLFLLVIIIISVLITVSLSSYFNRRYEATSNQYRNISAELKIKSSEVIRLQNELTALKNTLNQTSVDVQKYDEIYSQKAAELSNTKSLLEAEKKKTERLTATLQLREEEISSARREISNLNSELMSCKKDLSEIESELRICKINLRDAEESCK